MSGPIRIGVIPFLNCAPFYWDARIPGAGAIEWVVAPPARLGELARAGGLDAGPVSLLDCLRIEDRFEPLSGFGIAVPNLAGSVLLFSRRSIHRLGPFQVGITPQSATSSELLKLILKEVYGIAPRFRTGFSPDDQARLAIGDEALRLTLQADFRKEFAHAYDLGEEWRRWTDLPFVFARWMARKSLKTETRERLAAWLSGNVAAWQRNVAQVAAWHRDTAGWSYPAAERYLKRFIYRLGPQEEAAASSFISRLKGGTLITRCVP